MPQRLNYTGRQKILKQDVSIRIREGLDGLSFDAELHRLTEHYKLDPQARVYVEAYRSASTAWERWDFGRVGLLSQPEQRRLDKFGGADGVRFRVKVSAIDQEFGKLLAEADDIHPLLPDDPGQSDPLIDCQLADIGSEIWKVSFDPTASMPVLLISDRLSEMGWKELYKEPRFRALVAPSAMRQILTRILVVDGGQLLGDDEPEKWCNRWVRFSESLPGVPECPGGVSEDTEIETVEDWIDEAVRSFATRSGLFDRFFELRRQEVGQ